MKYILTQEEMNNLTDKSKSEEEIKQRDTALEWCREQLQLKECGNTYCDFCPVSWLGSDYVDGEYVRKEAGKGKTPTQIVSGLVCKKYRNYSK